MLVGTSPFVCDMPRYAPARFVRPRLVADGLRMVLVLAGLVAYAAWFPAPHRLILLLLGAVAAGLAETRRGVLARLLVLAVTVGCYGVVFSQWHWLLLHPLGLAWSLLLAVAVLLLGAGLRPRQASGSLAVLLLAICAAGPAKLVHTPLILNLPFILNLLTGAAWYAVSAVIWQVFCPQRTARQALVAVFEALAGYLECKARLFEPDSVHPSPRSQLELAMRNERIMRRLDEVWPLLLKQIGQPYTGDEAERDLQWYFFAQRIHGRASATHPPYEALSQALFHSDVLFRIQHLIQLHAQACRKRAQSLRLHFAYTGCSAGRKALADLGRSIDWLMLQPPRVSQDLRRALHAIRRDLVALQQPLDYQDPAPPAATPAALVAASSWRPPRAWFSLELARLSLALLAGLGLAWLAPAWCSASAIVLGVFLTCRLSQQTARQPWQRIGGILSAWLLSWAAVTGTATALGWLLLLAIGILLLAIRQRLQGLAAGSVTLLTALGLASVNGAAGSPSSFLPGLLLGAGLGWLALRYVRSDQPQQNLSMLLGHALRCHSSYLREEITHYLNGELDVIAYQQSRREALDADAALRQALACPQEPAPQPRHTETILQFLTYTHVLLGQLSSLGPHRQLPGSLDTTAAAAAYALIERATGCLTQDWEQIADQLLQVSTPWGAAQIAAPPLILQLEQGLLNDDDNSLQWVQVLLAELLGQLPTLRKLSQQAFPMAAATQAPAREAAGS